MFFTFQRKKKTLLKPHFNINPRGQTDSDQRGGERGLTGKSGRAEPRNKNKGLIGMDNVGGIDGGRSESGGWYEAGESNGEKIRTTITEQ